MVLQAALMRLVALITLKEKYRNVLRLNIFLALYELIDLNALMSCKSSLDKHSERPDFGTKHERGFTAY